MDGSIRHMDSVQNQSLFNTAQTQPVPPYQSFHPPINRPPSIMQPLGAGRMPWRPPSTIANSNPTTNYFLHPNEQIRPIRGNMEKDVYKEMKRSKQPSYAQGSNNKKSGVPIEGGLNEYGQVFIERMINHHQRDPEHNEKQQAEAAVHLHFEESLKLAQQQKQTNWISNLPTAPKTIFPNHGQKTQDGSKQKPYTLAVTNNRGIEEWKDHKQIFTPPRFTPIVTSSSEFSSHQASYNTQTVPKMNYDPENMQLNINERSNHHNMISYANYVNPNHGLTPSASSVIVKNDSSHKNRCVPEVYHTNRSPTILTIPAPKIDCDVESKQAKLSHYSRTSSLVHTSQSKLYNISQETHHPGPLLNTHGRYALYPPPRQPTKQLENASYSTKMFPKDLETPPPAHLNALMTSVLPKFTPTAVPVDDFQMEPLDLVVMCNTQPYNTYPSKTDVPLQNSQKKYAMPDSEETKNKYNSNHCFKGEQSDTKKCSPDNIVDLPLITVSSNSKSNSTIVSKILPSTSSITISTVDPVTVPRNIPLYNEITNPENIPTVVSKTVVSPHSPEISITTSAPIPTTMLTTPSSFTSSSLTTPSSSTSSSLRTPSSSTSSSLTTLSSSTSSSMASTSNVTTRDSSPSTPPPVLIPAVMPCGIKPYHHKLKKAWLQRHVWTEDMKEAGLNIDQSPPNFFSQINDTPPVLQCEVTNKRKKTKNTTKKKDNSLNMPSESSSDSDVEPQTSRNKTSTPKKRKVSNSTTVSGNTSAAESKDCTESVQDKSEPPAKIPKKRGRKPKVVVSIPLNNGKNNDGEIRFFQSGPCLNAGPNIYKCRECRIFMDKKKSNITTRDEMRNIFCRFYAFRRLFTNKNGQIMNGGFTDPSEHSTVDDLNLWIPNSKFPPKTLNVKVAKQILLEAGRHFCHLVKEENNASSVSPFFQDKPAAWKKAVPGVRETCDVCLTSIFNFHLACTICGFGVCIDCVKARIDGTAEVSNASSLTKTDLLEKDACMWMTCSDQSNHDIEKLMLTQIMAGDSMNFVFTKLHEICTMWNIMIECGCPGLPFSEVQSDVSSDDENYIETLNNKIRAVRNGESSSHNAYALESKILETSIQKHVSLLSDSTKKDTLKQFIRKRNTHLKILLHKMLPQRSMTLAQSRELFPKTPHTWLCNGKLLRLLNPDNPANYDLFRDQWKRGQPVLVSDVGKKLNRNLWTPESFSRDFGKYENDLINCATGMLVEGKKMKQFWNGFENETKRLKDSDGNYMLLKLKDWPGAADFSETLPRRFANLMEALPLKDYTHREGKLNLASRLPPSVVPPDLGPKMYSAYGNAEHHDPGEHLLSTTNLHLDVSDAVNVMVFVGITHKGGNENKREKVQELYIKAANRAIDEAGCDKASKKRARDSNEIPAAIWHIYHASDADSIRHMLNRVSIERGEPLRPNHDPIHDQTTYLDATLRARLLREYGVEGYAVLQCLGDAVFIPAGAPHQVRNLHNCIKVAEDFVSPENVTQCIRMMHEFRELSNSHSNREDKLQIKNIIYHAVKDSVSVMLHEKDNKKPKAQ